MLSPSARNCTGVPAASACSTIALKSSESRIELAVYLTRCGDAVNLRYSRCTDSFAPVAAAFLSASRAPSLPAGTDIPAFVAFSTRNGLLGLMYAKAISYGAGRLPPELIESMRAGAHRQAALELGHRAELRHVAAAMHGRGIEALLLKGASLAYDVYPDPALRIRSDTDLLVRESDRDRARACLEELGYSSLSEVAGRFVAYQFHCQRIDSHGIRHLYDVHWKIANPQRFANAIGFDDLAAQAVPLPLVGPSARGIGRVHALWLACVHRAAHHYDDDALVWLYDVHLLVEALGDGGLAQLVGLAERTGVRRLCLRALLLARDRLGTAVSPAVVAALETAPADEPSTLFLRPGIRKVDVLLDDVRMLRGWGPRLMLLKEHLFPDAGYLRTTYAGGSSAPVLWLYMRRIAGGASKWIRR